jgi:hypothetical protein
VNIALFFLQKQQTFFNKIFWEKFPTNLTHVRVKCGSTKTFWTQILAVKYPSPANLSVYFKKHACFITYGGKTYGLFFIVKIFSLCLSR